jgi:endoglucanase
MNLTDLKREALQTLEALCRIPSAPYYEQRGAEWVEDHCRKAGLDVRTDRYGNRLVTRRGTDAAATGLAFVAHLDHPGFEALSVEDGEILGQLRGGLNDAACAPGSRVQLIGADGRRIAGEIVASTGTGRQRSVRIRAKGAERRFGPDGLVPCGVVLDLDDFALDGDMIRARALDDLAGCAAIATTLTITAGEAAKGPVYGLFTRAEEVGLEGARLAAQDRLLPVGTTVVSVESSRTLPGAEIGCGPVIRVGDALSTFDRGAEAFLQAGASQLRARDTAFKYQRQLMSGGTCEASAFGAFGYAVTGLAFPLGNYHNNTPNGGVAAEFIHVSDFVDGVRLLAEVASLAGTWLEPAVTTRYRGRPNGEAKLLG